MTENNNTAAKRSIKSAEILCVGTELLLGDIVNTNAAFLSSKLAELGINVYRHTVVGDNPERLKAALASAFERADLVVTSGGLGPTYDDLTKETVAAFFGKKLTLHEESLARITDFFHRTGRVMAKNNEKQAYMPEGAIVFRNDYGTAPALAIEDGEEASRTIIMLPGPPGELCPIFNEQALPYLRERSGSVIFSKNVHLFGIGESTLEEKIKDIMKDSLNPTVAPYCKEGEVRLRVTAKAGSRDEAEELCDKMIERLYESEAGRFIYGIDVDSLERALLAELRKKELTLAIAEGCAGGVASSRFTAIPGASRAFLGAVVAYSDDVKIDLLGVDPWCLMNFGAVSEETASEMAKGIRLALGSDIGAAVTGIAGPDGGTPEKPVGTVWVAVSTQRGEVTRKLTLSANRSREYIRLVSASHLFHLTLSAVSPSSEVGESF